MNHIEIMKDALEKEIDSLNEVKNSLNEEYSKVINLILESKGNVVISGVGKSGIIAKKIVATMVSTGTKALFLHPTEALHGDLGIVTANDIVILISKSGNSKELLSLIQILKKMNVLVVSMTSNQNSSLGKQSDYILFMPIKEEACTLNLAPTSSTTVSLAIGDAIAISLMKARGFKEENFASFHPAGELGQKVFLKVPDIMRSIDKTPIININDGIDKMFHEITTKMIGSVLVVDNNFHLKGIITDYDIRKIVQNKQDIYMLKLDDIMNINPNYIFSDESVYTALEFMEKREKPISVLPVLSRETNCLEGIIHIHDIVG